VTDPTPGARPTTRPDASTSRTEVGTAWYAIFAFATVTPFTSRATVVSCTASPIAIVCFGAVMVTDKIDGLDGLSEQAVRNITAARIAVLILPARSRYAQWLRPLVADRIVSGCAIARYPR
jgi:hypothetical protein